MIPAKLRAVLTGFVALSLAGCATAVIHPINGKEFVVMKKDTPYTPDRNGYFVSQYYMKEIARVRVEDVNIEEEKTSATSVAGRILDLIAPKKQP